MIICRGKPTLIKSMKVYCPAGITRAFGGVENGEAKHIDAATETAKRKGIGLTPTPIAHCMAIGAISTAVTVLLINIVIIEVAKYTAANATYVPLEPNVLTIKSAIAVDTPVFSSAVDIGSIAAKSTMVCQLIVLYAASTLRTHPVMTINIAASNTAVTGATGIESTTIITIMAIMISAAIGAL